MPVQMVITSAAKGTCDVLVSLRQSALGLSGLPKRHVGSRALAKAALPCATTLAGILFAILSTSSHRIANRYTSASARSCIVCLQCSPAQPLPHKLRSLSLATSQTKVQDLALAEAHLQACWSGEWRMLPPLAAFAVGVSPSVLLSCGVEVMLRAVAV